MYLNKAIIIGNLTKDPELKSLPSGMKVATFSVATNRTWKDKNGVKQEKVDFHNITVFDRQAETVAQYMKKGSSLMVEGRIETRSWDKDGVKHYRTEIVADKIQFGPRKEGESGGGYTPNTKPQTVSDSPKPKIDTIEYPEEEINLEDIPF
jgi:single-strand DNA-binding protein